MKLCFLSLFIAALLISCEKSYENFDGTTPVSTDTIWSVTNTTLLPINQLHNSLLIPAMIDSFNINNGGTVQFTNNTRVEIPAAAFTNSGATVDGKAQIELHLLTTKGDLVRFRRPTTSNGYLLQSGGVLYINVSKNGQALQLKLGRTLHVSFQESNPTNLMQGFYGVPANTTSFDNFNWIPIQDTGFRIVTTANSYQVITNRLQWINCDYFSDTAAQKSRTVLSMPPDFTNANTSAFIVFKNIRSVMQFGADAANRIWKTEKVPVGKDVLYVTITKKGSDYWLGTADATTAALQNIHIVPVKTTLSALNSFLDNL